VQKRLSKWSLADPNLFTGGGCDLIIVDRGHDPVAPVIHPFHYASITHDLVPLTNGVFKYTWKNAKGEAQSSEHVVDSTDPMWADLRHMHVAEVADVATSRLKEFTESRLARVEREGAVPAQQGSLRRVTH
jgi:Sec1 family